MVRDLRQCFVAAVVLLLSAFSGDAQADDTSQYGTKVTDVAQIKDTMIGSTFGGVLEQTGQDWLEYYCDSGKSLFLIDNELMLGKWWLEESKVCFTYAADGYNHPECFDMYQMADRSISWVGFDKVNQQVMTFRSNPPVPGDPNHLQQRAARGCQPEPSA
jgi:hypothetical protein